ncbi:hypothetical protein [Natrialba asiatica]|uniref:DUF456 domain-containing protein n=1 Tax=Natrialba asiatica (strain ATCC 700177 / DSM 12278 / JCM 9576 / FERM P-10747 / NBRC 102637 / 172P1) TaxID=29540 RepID=M0AL86_NATA1|nr:hypothetical protein [Natrialba asiatica]ELY99314.1 hypothetical protein C481_15725 [Natrialba asiatica DSM 12278]
MNDRSDEVTERRESPSTDDLLSETEQLLSDTGSGTGPDTSSGDRQGREQGAIDAGSAVGSEPADEFSQPAKSAEPAAGRSDGSRLAGLTDRLSPRKYFSPKAFLALALTIGAGLFVGDAVLPIAGQMIGIFATAFLVGLITSKRRYLELTAAGALAGAITPLADPVYVALGAGRTLIAIGLAIGLVASVAGYYFGRDLRDGLSRDVT